MASPNTSVQTRAARKRSATSDAAPEPPKKQPRVQRRQLRAKKVSKSDDDEEEPAAVIQNDRLPNPAERPPLSSDIRAAMCDTTPYWRAHQGGLMSKDNVATGMLLNGRTTPRDTILKQVIITTVYVYRSPFTFQDLLLT
jgi:hypothetical protein